jgi:hypothetical protein
MPVILYEILRTLYHVLECLYAQHISDVVTVVCLVLLIVCSTFLVSCGPIRSLIESGFGEKRQDWRELFYGVRKPLENGVSGSLNSVLSIQLQLIFLLSLLSSSPSNLLVIDSVNLT